MGCAYGKRYRPHKKVEFKFISGELKFKEDMYYAIKIKNMKVLEGSKSLLDRYKKKLYYRADESSVIPAIRKNTKIVGYIQGHSLITIISEDNMV